jgi:Uma2 family endonuclease
MANPVRAPATLADLEALPPTVKGEILDGVLYTQARPGARHQWILSCICSDVVTGYDAKGGGVDDSDAGGWWILPEPGITVPGSPEFSPDIAGWRRERLLELPEDEAISVVPNWVCEILSPRTRSYDQRTKKPFYARSGVQFIWYVDIQARTLTVSRLHEGRWLEIGTFIDDDVVRAEPFEAAEIRLVEFWPASPAEP